MRIISSYEWDDDDEERIKGSLRRSRFFYISSYMRDIASYCIYYFTIENNIKLKHRVESSRERE